MNIYKKFLKKLIILFFCFFNFKLITVFDKDLTNLFGFCDSSYFDLKILNNLNLDLSIFPTESPLNKINLIIGNVFYLDNLNYLITKFENLNNVENGFLNISGNINSPIANQDYNEFILNLKNTIYNVKSTKNISILGINIDFSSLDDESLKDENNSIKAWVANFIHAIKNDTEDINEINLQELKLMISFPCKLELNNCIFSENVKNFILDLNYYVNEDQYNQAFDLINFVNFDFFDLDYSLLKNLYFKNIINPYLVFSDYEMLQENFNPKIFSFTFKLNFKNSLCFEEFQNLIENLNAKGFTNFGILNFNDYYSNDVNSDLKNLNLIIKTLYIN